MRCLSLWGLESSESEGEGGVLGVLLKWSMGAAGGTSAPGVCPTERHPTWGHRNVLHPPGLLWNEQLLWHSSPGGPCVGSSAKTALMQEGWKPNLSSSRREITI